ncbi:flagellar basal body rod protein FlgB [Dermatophilaceae bacterium Soc4.6]
MAVTDAVSRVLSSALDGVSLRQSVIADNIANVDTPHFTASAVDFESALRSAVADGSMAAGQGGVAASRSAESTPVGANGNNVDLRKETLAGVQAQYQYQILSRAVSDRYERIHESLSGA